MSSLQNHPIYTLIFIFLIIAYIVVNRHSNGKNLKPKNAYKLINDASTTFIDIRSEHRYKRFHIKNSINDQNASNLNIYKAQYARKIVLIYDSNISLTMYLKLAEIEKFPVDIFCLYMPDYQVYSNQHPELNALHIHERCSESSLPS